MTDHPDDLTILTLFSGESPLFRPYWDALRRLRKPGRVQLLFIDNSDDPNFYGALKGTGGEVFRFPGKLRLEDIDWSLAEDYMKVPRHCAKLYHFAKPHVRGRRLLIWEHDVIPPPDALARLERCALSKRADIVSGAILSRRLTEYQAWRVREGKPERGIWFVPLIRKPKRVFATGFGFLLLDSKWFREMPVCVQSEGLPFWGCDLNAGYWAFQRGLRWFAEGSVRCAHLEPDGHAIQLGHVRDLRRGRLLNLAGKESDL
ncbi:MAG TPA: hypothetical protein PKL97_06485 [Candidatus Omnitrophota bacterium]|nr:hypothetical protein [Candidatus Omnitrophota bacterium]